ncbi:MAG: Phosphopentomutase [Alphaproteobacteria bacterium ADurb.Bin438]|nr:MAG: Phosphopentomutase [Alphaproteobacteria bacterium ADurb.Bin438]
MGNIAKHYFDTKNKAISLPNFKKLGLFNLYHEIHKSYPKGIEKGDENPSSLYTYAKEVSTGKSTFCGHMEIAGAPVDYELGYYPNGFDKEIIERFLKETGLKGVLGNCVASGTKIIEDLGEEHIKTGYPIIYTSADSVFQIAAHEEHFGLDNLYKACEIARKICDDYNVATVIARPFLGDNPSNFKRTTNRHDYTITSKYKTMLENIAEDKGEVIAIGKIRDIYDGKGVTKAVKAAGLCDIFDKFINEINLAPQKSLVFANFVNFDMDFGHRRNPIGYGEALEYFDTRLPELLNILKPDDILIFTADHGCDPTFKGTDHTREFIPVIIVGNAKAGFVNRRETFSDIGQTIVKYLGVKPVQFGKAIF